MPFLLILFLCPVSPSELRAQDENVESEYLFAALFDNHKKIDSGVFRISGSFEDPGGEFGPISGPIKILCGFDFESGRTRLDLQRPVLFKQEGRVELVDRKSKFAQTGKFVLYWDNVNGIVFVRPKDSFYGAKSNFDVRLLGWVNSSTFDSLIAKQSFDWEDYSATLMKALCLVEYQGERVVLSREMKEHNVSIRNELNAKGVPVPRKYTLSSGSRVEDSIEMEWQEIDGIMVPKTYVQTKADRTVKYFFEWESLNQGIPDHYFDIEEFGLPPDTCIIDERSDPAVSLGVIGESFIRDEQVVRSDFTYYWVFGSVTCLAILAATLWYWRR